MDTMSNLSKYLPHVGLRKLKSVLAVFIGFWVWQLIRLVVPELELHPIYIYIYGIVEMRDSSDKTVNFGKRRIKATFVALGIGLPLLLLNSYLNSIVLVEWVNIAIDLGIILIGVLLVLCVAEWTGCINFCGLAAAILVILLVAHSESEPLHYSLLRSVQTIIGVFIAWLINVKLFPYPIIKDDKVDIKAAIFDMDGTLVDSLMMWDVLWSEFGKRFLGDEGFRPNEMDDKKVRTLTLKDAMQLMHDNYKIGNSGEELLEVANNLLVEFYSERVQLKEGVKFFLDVCYKNGTKMCIASATEPELIQLALKHCDIEKYFLRVFSCAELGVGKEKPDVFLLAQEFLGTGNNETWVFEDSLVAIETATKIGFQTVGIFDRYNFGQEQIKAIATRYIAEGENLTALL